MKVVALDDEVLLLDELIESIEQALPDASIHSFTKASDVLNYVEDNPVDIAFLDIKLRGKLTGIDVAQRIQKKYPNVNIIFTTSYLEYGVDAINIRCSGYLTKPILPEDIIKEMEHLRNPIVVPKSKIRFQCFGNFEVFYDEHPVDFKNHKTRELLAYLVDRNGCMCLNREIMATLWEDGKLHNSYYKKIREDLITTFDELGCGDVIINRHGELGIDKKLVDCDYYDWLDGKNDDLYQGEYMIQYSWAEYTISY